MALSLFSMCSPSAHGVCWQPLGEWAAVYPFSSRSPLSLFTGIQTTQGPTPWFLPPAPLHDGKHKRSCIRLYI
jgi:hypothetical protein